MDPNFALKKRRVPKCDVYSHHTLFQAFDSDTKIALTG